MIVGMMWNKNEGDILEEIITNAVTKVDTLLIADDGSTDKSWEIIKSAKEKFDNIEHVQQKPNRGDKGQRESLLKEIKKRYKPEDIWVQIIESDMMISPFTDVHEKVKTHSVADVAMYWRGWNCIRDVGTWHAVDTYPNWELPLTELMPRCHRMENMMYTFRPLPETTFAAGGAWRPWPSGLAKYIGGIPKAEKYRSTPPVVMHYGHRGPTQFYEKYKNMGAHHSRYKNWKLGSVKEVEMTVSYFNGDWNAKGFIPTPQGFRNRHKERHRLPKLTESRYDG